MHWLLEPDVFGEGPPPLLPAARRAGHGVTIWRDDWWSSGAFPVIDDEAYTIASELPAPIPSTCSTSAAPTRGCGWWSSTR